MPGSTNVPVIIPAYNPGEELVALVSDLLDLGLSRIVAIDDGSSAGATRRFAALEWKGITVLRHAVNLGKGAALKTGLNYALLQWPEAVGFVTADADGQHAAGDIAAVARRLTESPGTLVLGARRFDGEVPRRSRIGNRISAHLLRWLAGTRVSDSQTGLRGIPAALALQLLKLPSQRYEFELDMLLQAKHQGIAVVEVPIQTIYRGNNESSHFNPLWDSMRITFTLFRFSMASALTAILDNTIFALYYTAGGGILGSQVAARCVALAFNYAAARGAVFHSAQPHASVLPKYLLLVAVNAALSYFLIVMVHRQLAWAVIPAKIAVEALLFLANFAIQRDFIFSVRPGAARATDWTRYYESVPATAHLTRRYSAGVLVKMLRGAGLAPNARVVEIGGANSCFYDRLSDEFEPSGYDVVDTNRHGLDLLERRKRDSRLTVRCESIFALPAGEDADLVFSAGLVEHFDPAGTRDAIAAHFQQARPGALVLITFPTPTRLYRATRSLLEFLGLWKFPDERPLDPDEARRTIISHGEILAERTLWPILLTQRVILARKRLAVAP